MTVTLSYDDVLSRVQIDVTGLTGAQTALIERSTDQVRWTTVRGASALPVNGSGGFDLPHDDYEFSPDVANYYRVTADRLTVANDPFTRVAANSWGAEPVTGATYSLQTAAGDYDVNGSAGTIEPGVSAEDRSATVDVNAVDVQTQAKFSLNTLPASSTFDFGLVARGTDTANWYVAKGRIATTGVVTLLANKRVGGSSTDITSIAAGVTMVVATQYTLKAEVLEAGPTIFRIKLWATADPEPDAWTLETTDVSGAPPATGDRIGVFARNNSVTLSRIITVDDLLVYDLSPAAETSSITPVLSGTWLKSIARPFLNQIVQVINRPSVTVTRPARVGVFDIVGRTLPVAVTDVRKSRRGVLILRTTTEEAADNLDLLLASGDVVLFQAPALCSGMVTGYLALEDAVREHHPLRPLRVTWTLPYIEVAAPGPDVVGTTVTWQSVLNAYATWADVIAAHATWADLLTLIGSPDEVIVP